VAASSDSRSPMALAFEWVSKITTVVLEMTVPALAGWWLDAKLGTGNLLTIGGLVFGFVVGIAHLLAMTGRKPKGGDKNGESVASSDGSVDRSGGNSRVD
jgi:F0F1-type ATP synthase assembly protein I